MVAVPPGAQTTATEKELAQAGFQHVEGAPEPLPLERPEFSVKDLRAAIPPHCFERSLFTSMSHVVIDVSICAALFYAATYIDTLQEMSAFAVLLWPVYWFFQGSYGTGIWVLAHECGHEGFSDYKLVNDTVGLILHSALLVPYHSWRISHRRHHSNTNSCENDEVFVPCSRSDMGPPPAAGDHLEDAPIYQLYSIFYMLLVGWMPGYLFFNATGPKKYQGQSKSHFNPYSAIYSPRERWMIILSDIGLVVVAAGLGYAINQFGFTAFAKFYLVPYMIVNAYLVLITFLQHTDTFVPHFREGEWTWLRGALCTVDRTFGSYLDGVLHHIVDTHVVHHIFSKMPFYHAEEATEALRPVLGKFYLKDNTPVPAALWRSYHYCKFVEDDGKIVFYKKDLRQ